MKKTKFVLIILTVVLLTLVLTGCGNMSLGIGNFEFRGVHICDHAGNATDAVVSRWYDTTNGIEIELADGNNVFLSEGTYILFENECPICNK